MIHSARPNLLQRSVSFFQTKPSDNPDRFARDRVLNVLYLGTLGLIVVALIVVCINYLVLQIVYLAPRIAIIGLIGIAMTALYIHRQRHYHLAAYSLLTLYAVAASAAIWVWGSEAPIGVLLFAMDIVFAGILLGARYALYALALVMVILITLTLLATNGGHTPDTSWANSPAGLYDVAAFGSILGNLALVTWLFNRSIEQSLRRAQDSERELQRQKDLLEVKVEKRTREMRAAQFERVQEMYRLAEVGHMSVALLHDTANYLSVLSLDIEDLRQARQNRSEVLSRVQQSIRRLNSLIGQVRSQIRDEAAPRRFNLADEISEVARLLNYKAAAQQVTISVECDSPKKKLWCIGSINQFWQIMTNLISNAIDAYDPSKKENQRRVVIRLDQTPASLSIAVIDFGIGIPHRELSKIFEPFYSTKKRGMGIGLTVTKRMVERGFGGKLTVVSGTQGTTFMFTIPHETAAHSKSN